MIFLQTKKYMKRKLKYFIQVPCGVKILAQKTPWESFDELLSTLCCNCDIDDLIEIKFFNKDKELITLPSCYLSWELGCNSRNEINFLIFSFQINGVNEHIEIARIGYFKSKTINNSTVILADSRIDRNFKKGSLILDISNSKIQRRYNAYNGKNIFYYIKIFHFLKMAFSKIFNKNKK